MKFDLASDGDGIPGFQIAGQYLNLDLLPLAVGGGFVLYRRSRRDLVIVAAPILAAALSAAATFGSTRYRAVAEPSIAVLAASGTVQLFWYLIHQRQHIVEHHQLATTSVPNG